MQNLYNICINMQNRVRYLLHLYVIYCISTLFIVLFVRYSLHLYVIYCIFHAKFIAYLCTFLFSPPQVYQMNILRCFDKLLDNLEI